MLAEGAHSVADTVNQLFLLTAITPQQEAGRRAAPLRLRRWSATSGRCSRPSGIFVLGGVLRLRRHRLAAATPSRSRRSPWSPYVVLGVSFLFEGTSWTKAVLQLRREAGRAADRASHQHVITHARSDREDGGLRGHRALVGILLAALGSPCTPSPARPLGRAASIRSARSWSWSRSRWVGERSQPRSASRCPARFRDGIPEVINESAGVDAVVELLTLRLGPVRCWWPPASMSTTTERRRPGAGRRPGREPDPRSLPRGPSRVPRPDDRHRDLCVSDGRTG